MRREMMNSIHVLPLFVPGAAVTDNTAQVSAIIDTSGFDSLTLAMVTGNLTDPDATFTVLVEDSNAADMSDHSAVDDMFLAGTEALASFTFADDAESRKIAYIGPKRYVRVTVTPANNSGNLFLAGLAILGHPRSAPTPNPPM